MLFSHRILGIANSYVLLPMKNVARKQRNQFKVPFLKCKQLQWTLCHHETWWSRQPEGDENEFLWLWETLVTGHPLSFPYLQSNTPHIILMKTHFMHYKSGCFCPQCTKSYLGKEKKIWISCRSTDWYAQGLVWHIEIHAGVPGLVLLYNFTVVIVKYSLFFQNARTNLSCPLGGSRNKLSVRWLIYHLPGHTGIEKSKLH